MNELEITFIRKTLTAIQDKYNFNPESGAVQVANQPAIVQRKFGQFELLRSLIKKFSIDADVSYNKSGGKTKLTTSLVNKESFVYLAQIDGTDIWKIGSSKSPNTRVNGLQTGNDGTIYVRYTFPGGRKLEKNIQRVLKKYKTRDKSKPNKGEWFSGFPNEFYKELAAFYLRGNEFDYYQVKSLAERFYQK